MAVFDPGFASYGAAFTCHRPGILRTCCSDLTSSFFTRSAFNNCQTCPCGNEAKTGERKERADHRPVCR